MESDDGMARYGLTNSEDVIFHLDQRYLSAPSSLAL